MKTKYKKKVMTIGTDPEFIFSKNGKLISANDFNCFCSTIKKIGCDGAGTPLEIRPYPAPINELKILIRNIENIMKEIAHFCNEKRIDLLGGAYIHHNPIGGHIHFGHPDLTRKDIFDNSPKGISDRKRLDRNVQKIRIAMDVLFMPLANSILDECQLHDRRHNGYGRLGDVRYQPYGIEYRSPYSFLLSPYLTKTLFALACLIGWHYKKIKIPENYIAMIRNYYNKIHASRLNNKVDTKLYKFSKKTVLRLLSYSSPNPDYDSYIVSLFSPIEQNKKISLDVLENWKLKKFKSEITAGNRPIVEIHSGDLYYMEMLTIFQQQFRISLQNTLRHNVLFSSIPFNTFEIDDRLHVSPYVLDHFKQSGMRVRFVKKYSHDYYIIGIPTSYIEKWAMKKGYAALFKFIQLITNIKES